MTMPKRYIDADAFERAVMFSDDEDLQDVIYRLRDYPTADVVARSDIQSELDLAYKHGWSDCEAKRRWIPVSERLPENTDPVNITWVNHKPVSYYASIKDKPFTATGCYCDGKWYWYSVTCQDYLDEYRYCDVDAMDSEIEVIAWMPLPEPYREEREDAQLD